MPSAAQAQRAQLRASALRCRLLSPDDKSRSPLPLFCAHHLQHPTQPTPPHHHRTSTLAKHHNTPMQVAAPLSPMGAGMQRFEIGQEVWFCIGGSTVRGIVEGYRSETVACVSLIGAFKMFDIHFEDLQPVTED